MLTFRRSFLYGLGLFALTVFIYHPESSGDWILSTSYIGGFPIPLLGYDNIADPKLINGAFMTAINAAIVLIDSLLWGAAFYLGAKIVKAIR